MTFQFSLHICETRQKVGAQQQRFFYFFLIGELFSKGFTSVYQLGCAGQQIKK